MRRVTRLFCYWIILVLALFHCYRHLKHLVNQNVDKFHSAFLKLHRDGKIPTDILHMVNQEMENINRRQIKKMDDLRPTSHVDSNDNLPIKNSTDADSTTAAAPTLSSFANQTPLLRNSKEEDSSKPHVLWRKDGRCGSRYKLLNGKAARCDPGVVADMRGPCCSRHGYCGPTAKHCECKGCVDHRKDFEELILQTKGNVSNLDKNHHASKLASTFKCHDKPLKLLITVISPIEHFEKRNAVRSTWGSNLSMRTNDEYQVFFIIGKSHNENIMSLVMQESKQHRDIIMGDFYENNSNDFLKTDIVLEWSFKYCEFQFLLYTDEDTFIHMKNLIHLLDSWGNVTEKYVGNVNSLYINHRMDKSVNMESLPHYVSSSSVLFSKDVVKTFMLYAFDNRYRFPPSIYMALIALDANIRGTRNKAFISGDGVEKCVYNEEAISLQFAAHSLHGLDCMTEFYYEMLARNADDSFIHKHYYDRSKAVIDSNRRYNKMSKEIKNLYIDTRYIVNANYSNLDKRYHVGRLISTFPCHTKPLKVIVMLLSHPVNYKRRNAVRSTWGKTKKDQVNEDFRVFFVVGKVHNQDQMDHVHKESNTYGDIVFGDFYESFYNNSWKIETMMEYSFKHCQFEFLLKVDDDNFVHMSNVFKLLSGLKSNTKIYLGRRVTALDTVRDSAIKYMLTYDEYRNTRLPPFIAGGAVIMSHDAVQGVIPYLFLGVSKPPMKLEDVYTGFLALNAGIPVTHSKSFKHSDNGRCLYDRKALSLHFWNREQEDEVACMFAMQKAMLKHDAADPFVNLHYSPSI